MVTAIVNAMGHRRQKGGKRRRFGKQHLNLSLNYLPLFNDQCWYSRLLCRGEDLGKKKNLEGGEEGRHPRDVKHGVGNWRAGGIREVKPSLPRYSRYHNHGLVNGEPEGGGHNGNGPPSRHVRYLMLAIKLIYYRPGSFVLGHVFRTGHASLYRIVVSAYGEDTSRRCGSIPPPSPVPSRFALFDSGPAYIVGDNTEVK